MTAELSPIDIVLVFVAAVTLVALCAWWEITK